MDCEKVFNQLFQETADYVLQNNIESMILGISGGIDSTIVAAICNEVSLATNIPLIGRSLPINNKNDEFSTSILVGKAFCDNFNVIFLDWAYTGMMNSLLEAELNKQQFPENRWDYSKYIAQSKVQTPIANGNIQARLRMIYLYNLAGLNNGIVMSTDNQTEYQLGFWTIHGDVGDFDPIQDLWKTEVYDLAEWISNKYAKIIQEVKMLENDVVKIRKYAAMKKALDTSMELIPTDGLGISSSDLHQIGAKSYNDVDDILQHLLDKSLTTKEYIKVYQDLCNKYTKEVVDKIMERNKKSQFKREKAPIKINLKIK